MRKIAVVLGVLCVSSTLAYSAQTERSETVEAVYSDYGNTDRQRNVDISTTNLVILSSSAVNAVRESSGTKSLGISVWRFREIVNVSTCANLALYPTPGPRYNQYSSSDAVVLSSDTLAGRAAGDAYAVPHQGEVWGIWEPSGTCGGAGQGVVVTETYYSENRNR